MQAEFNKMGAEVIVLPANRFTRSGLNVNVVRGVFTVVKPDTVSLSVLDHKPKNRHLLLMAKDAVNSRHIANVTSKFLCGHDERDWFVASVPSRVTSVEQAMDSLRPAPVGEALLKAGVPARKRHKRHNKAYIRQGEWFFVPEPDFKANPLLILKNEPLVRAGGGKPHVVQELYRFGGDTVYVHPSVAASGVKEKEYKKMLKDTPTGWRLMKRNPTAYARGSIRHADHATIRLNGWHRIFMNAEVRSSSLGFLD